MGSSRALVCCTAFTLVLLCSASKDEHIIEQREVTFDIDKIMQEIQPPNSFMLQREMDMTDLLDLKDMGQVIESPPEQFDTLNERGRPSFVPRSFVGPPMLNYPVEFPLGRPTSDNLQAICFHGDRRPLYPDSYFPPSGFGQQKRRASAINKAESWFGMCCKGNQTWGQEVTLCCATQAWKLSIQNFCEEDSSVKDRLYDCCRLTGSNRLNCFHNDAPNPNYNPMVELLVPPLPSAANFNFDPNTCQRTVMTPYSIRANRKKKGKKPSTSQKVDINFPPGRPTVDAIESLCRNQRQRPLYNVKCLPGSGYELVARQAKTINRIEKGFKQCCKKTQDVLNCTDGKWREELNKFCLGGNSKQEEFHCCSTGDGANDRYSCFQNIAPDPHYNMTSATEEFTVNKICVAQKLIKKMFPAGIRLVTQCCPLSEQDKTICFEKKLKEASEKLCLKEGLSKKVSSPVVRRCCRVPSQEAPQCISKMLTDTITKAINVLRQKKKKRCPLS